MLEESQQKMCSSLWTDACDSLRQTKKQPNQLQKKIKAVIQKRKWTNTFQKLKHTVSFEVRNWTTWPNYSFFHRKTFHLWFCINMKCPNSENHIFKKLSLAVFALITRWWVEKKTKSKNSHFFTFWSAALKRPTNFFFEDVIYGIGTLYTNGMIVYFHNPEPKSSQNICMYAVPVCLYRVAESWSKTCFNFLAIIL